jgi:acetyl-CoA synthetase
MTDATIDAARRRYDELYRRSLDDPETFWLDAAKRLDWTLPPERALDLRTPSSFAWFPGGRTNLSFNALDRHVAAGRGDAAALITLDERGGRRALSYAELLAEVERVAAGLRGLRIGKGDRVTIYMPTSEDAIVAMLATVRIGAIHCVVFAGFGAGALGDRIRASGSRLVLTTDVTYRKGKDVDLLSIVDDAIDAGPSDVEHVVVLRRSETSRPPRAGELSWDDLVAAGEGQSGAV